MLLDTDKAILNSNIGFERIKEKFKDRKFPERQNYESMDEVVKMLLES
jgi:hypothetical protein